MDNEPRRLADVVGENARELRRNNDLTLDQVGIAARQVGLKWSDSRVADFEAGRVAPSLQTLVGYCSVMATLGCTVHLADLVHGQHAVAITDELTLPTEKLAAWLNGDPVEAPEGAEIVTSRPAFHPDPSEQERQWLSKDFLARLKDEKSHDIGMRSGTAEARVQRTLNLTPEAFAALSSKLWGRTFSEERNARAGVDANAQKRGQISRQLIIEAKEELSSGRDK